MTDTREQFPIPQEYLDAVRAHNEALEAELVALAKYRSTQSTEDGNAAVAAHYRARELRKAKLAVEPDWLMVKSVVRLKEPVDRRKDAVKCPECGGYAPRVDCTAAEIKSDMNCGQPWACCVAAFVCDACQTRIVARRDAPEME
jgi:hypothetical protein